MSAISAVLAVGGHAADMEFTAGAVIAKYTRAGARAVLLHATPGEMGHPRLSGPAYAQQKQEEAQRAAQILGAEARFLPYADAALPHDDTVAYQIADVIREVRPEVVLTHWRGSFHADHVNTYLNTERALFLAALPAITRAHPAHTPSTVLYPENWEDMDGFDPTLYVEIDDVYEQWLEAANQYELFRGGVSTFRYRDYYQALATLRGCLAGFERAVALMRPKEALIGRVAGLPPVGTPGFVI